MHSCLHFAIPLITKGDFSSFFTERTWKSCPVATEQRKKQFWYKNLFYKHGNSCSALTQHWHADPCFRHSYRKPGFSHLEDQYIAYTLPKRLTHLAHRYIPNSASQPQSTNHWRCLQAVGNYYFWTGFSISGWIKVLFPTKQHPTSLHTSVTPAPPYTSSFTLSSLLPSTFPNLTAPATPPPIPLWPGEMTKINCRSHTPTLTGQAAKQSKWLLSSHCRPFAEMEGGVGGKQTQNWLLLQPRSCFHKQQHLQALCPSTEPYWHCSEDTEAITDRLRNSSYPSPCYLPTDEQGKAIRPFMTFNRNSTIRLFFQQFLHSKS